MNSLTVEHETGYRPPFLVCLAIAALLFLPAPPDAGAAEPEQRFFSSPAEAVEALVAAIRTDDPAAMAAVLGPGSMELLSSGDEVADRRGRERFLQAHAEGSLLEDRSEDRATLVLGSRNWPLPIPLVKKNGLWGFDSLAGKEEILNRRIGRNELRVIEVLHAYVNAQHEYATRDCMGGGRVEFAQKLASSPGQRNGLYWPAQEGEKESPFGPLIARAARHGYTGTDLSPFQGYYFKILKGQGSHATGGAYSYMVGERMLLGFALVAYPAEYGNSGIMTFVVNQEGAIFQKNLGEETKRIAEEIELFDPDPTWRRVEEEPDLPLP